MYAIVGCGGKQYKVEKDMLVKVEKIDAEVGAKVELEVLMFVDDEGSVKAGADAAKVKVEAVVNAQGKFPKVDVFHYKPKRSRSKPSSMRRASSPKWTSSITSPRSRSESAKVIVSPTPS